ncbi:hypothetical protein ACOSQ4_026843 [Xanthoceras sorbifolium]
MNPPVVATSGDSSQAHSDSMIIGLKQRPAGTSLSPSRSRQQTEQDLKCQQCSTVFLDCRRQLELMITT